MFPRLRSLEERKKVVKALRLTADLEEAPEFDREYRRAGEKKFGPYYRLRWERGGSVYLGNNERLVEWFRVFLELVRDPVGVARRALGEGDPYRVVEFAEAFALLESGVWREVVGQRGEVRRLGSEVLGLLEEVLERLELLEARVGRLEEGVGELGSGGLLWRFRRRRSR